MQRLLNRRFVPFYVDMFGGFAADADAERAIAKVRPKLAGGRIDINPVLFLTPEGEVVGETTVTASAKQLLSKMREILARHPEFNQPTAAEKAGLERANALFDLDHYEDAQKLLAKLGNRYLAGHLARLKGDWKRMERAFDGMDTEDVRLERAHAAWRRGKLKRMAELAAAIPRTSKRYTEARYLLGVAQYRSGDKKKAHATWEAAITADHDRWIYKMDWALAGGGGKSRIGRIAYYFPNPDLDS